MGPNMGLNSNISNSDSFFCQESFKVPKVGV